MATHGAAPTMQPNQNGPHHTFSPGGLTTSITQPNRIMAALAAAITISAAMSVIPVIVAMITIISVAENEYSTQRNRFRPCSSSRRYTLAPGGTATTRWNNADRNANAAT